MKNAADRKQVRHAEKVAKAIQSADDAFLTDIMSTAEGRAWIWRRLEAASVFVNAFTADSRQEAFNLGLQAAGQTLLADVIRVCPNDFIQAMKEANNERTKSEPGADSGTDSGTGPAPQQPRSPQSGRVVEGADAYPEPGTEEG